MKALEKAAKDRGTTQPAAAATEAGPVTPAPPASAKPELSLEPLSAETPPLEFSAEPQPKPGVAARAAPTPAPAPRVAPAAAPRAAPAPRAASVPAPEPAAPRTGDQTKAASIVQAGQRKSGGVVAYLRGHPVVVLGTLAGIFLAGFGLYVYLQIANPALFVRQAPPAARPPAPLAQPPAAVPQPLATAPLIQSGAEAGGTQPAGATPAPPAKPPAPAVAAAVQGAQPEAPRSGIVVSRGSAVESVPPLLAQAYAAFEANRLDEAGNAYNQLLRADPKNVDALLGLAGIAMQEDKTDEAAKLYLQILRLDPRHVLAQSGLIAILGRADPLAAEARLKQLISREPSAFLYFTLGNLYADQSLWAQAQQAYFQAYHLEPANPDYAYNLAIGLEHLSQSGLALGFYRRAVQLAAAKGRVNFSLPQAQERITQLVSRLK